MIAPRNTSSENSQNHSTDSCSDIKPDAQTAQALNNHLRMFQE